MANLLLITARCWGDAILVGPHIPGDGIAPGLKGDSSPWEWGVPIRGDGCILCGDIVPGFVGCWVPGLC